MIREMSKTDCGTAFIEWGGILDFDFDLDTGMTHYGMALSGVCIARGCYSSLDLYL